MMILGIGGILDDAAAALLIDGRIVAAAEELKIARRARPGRLPEFAISACLEQTGVKPERVDTVAVARPFSTGPDSRLHLELRQRFPNAHMVVVEHDAAHAAAAYFASPFEEATVLTIDRRGDFRCGSRWRASGNRLMLEKESYAPDSIGELYGRVTELLGFQARADEHKVQWMSTAGDDRFAGLFLEILGMAGDGMAGNNDWPRLDRGYFSSDRVSHGAFAGRFYRALGIAEGIDVPESLQVHVAAGLQKAVETAVLRMAGTGTNFCGGGGLFFNALLVRALETSGQFQNVYVQPAAGNAGTALGAAYYAWNVTHRQPERFPLATMALGPSFSAEATKRVLENCKLRVQYLLTVEELMEAAVRVLGEHKIVAWMQGRMEFGPRALGNRSILASPLDPYAGENLNVYIKHREAFRKFAASVPAELAPEYFEAGPNARNLATVGVVKPAHRKTFAGALLGGGHLRIHTVDREENPLFHRLLLESGKKTGLPVLYNTSFNLFGDPLVSTPRDAVRSFYSSGIDALFAGNFLVEK